MSGALLDTHALVWLMAGDERFGPKSREMTNAALRSGRARVSAISFWEIALLAERGRLSLTMPPAQWRGAVLELGLEEVPLDGGTAVFSVTLEGMPSDPADRFIVGSALRGGYALITADARILEWEGELLRHDARE